MMSQKQEQQIPKQQETTQQTSKLPDPPVVEPQKKQKQRETCVYCGPSVKGVVRQFTVYTDGNMPQMLRDLMQAHPGMKGLVTSIEQFPVVRRNLENKQSAEAILFQKLKLELSKSNSN